MLLQCYLLIYVSKLPSQARPVENMKKDLIEAVDCVESKIVIALSKSAFTYMEAISGTKDTCRSERHFFKRECASELLLWPIKTVSCRVGVNHIIRIGC